MNTLIIIVATLVPLLPLILFPARTIGRGGTWTYVGAALLVGASLAIVFSLQAATDTPPAAAGTATASAGLSPADIKALDALLK